MKAMFSGCENLKELNLKEMDVSCVAKFNKMFYNSEERTDSGTA